MKIMINEFDPEVFNEGHREEKTVDGRRGLAFLRLCGMLM